MKYTLLERNAFDSIAFFLSVDFYYFWNSLFRKFILHLEKYPGGNLQPAWYRASTAEGFAILA